MSEEDKKVVPQNDPQEAEPGRGAPGNQVGVQTAQTTAVNPPDAQIPSNVDVQENVEEVEAVKAQEEGTTVKTTDGFAIDESSRLDNFPIEIEPYVEEDK